MANNPLRRLSFQIFAPNFVKRALLILALWDSTFHGKFGEKDYALAIYNRHIEEVKQRVPPERLLVYNVKEGWEPLCTFLNVAVPEIPFPHLNESGNFVGNSRWQRIYARRKRALAIVAALAALFVGLQAWHTLQKRLGKR